MNLTTLGDRLAALLKRIAFGILFNDDTKAQVIQRLNAAIDIPFVSEAQEAELFGLIYDTTREALQDILDPQTTPKS